jgi:hypothetical protein
VAAAAAAGRPRTWTGAGRCRGGRGLAIGGGGDEDDASTVPLRSDHSSLALVPVAFSTGLKQYYPGDYRLEPPAGTKVRHRYRGATASATLVPAGAPAGTQDGI